MVTAHHATRTRRPATRHPIVIHRPSVASADERAPDARHAFRRMRSVPRFSGYFAPYFATSLLRYHRMPRTHVTAGPDSGAGWRPPGPPTVERRASGRAASGTCHSPPGGRAPVSCRRSTRARAASCASRSNCSTVSVVCSPGLTTATQPSAPYTGCGLNTSVGRVVARPGEAARFLAREPAEGRPVDVHVHAPAARRVELGGGVVGVVLGDDRPVGLHVLRHHAVGRVVEERVAPGELGRVAPGPGDDHECAVEVSHGFDDLIHTHSSSITFKCFCGVG